MIVPLTIINQFEIGNSYCIKNRDGQDCIYTVVDRNNTTVTFCKTWYINSNKITEYKKFKINTNDFTEKVLVWAYQNEKCYIYANSVKI